MTPVLSFFNNNSRVGTTSLVYHTAWMLSELEHKVLVVDLDPQASLTAEFLDEYALAELWEPHRRPSGGTICQCVAPLAQAGDVRPPEFQRYGDGIHLLPGDLDLSRFEDELSTQWPYCLDSNEDRLLRAFRVVTAFWQVLQIGISQSHADIVLVDVGPGLGAINRSAMIASDFVAVPLADDLFSRQGLRNLGPALREWRSGWKKRLDSWKEPSCNLPSGNMQPIGYTIRHHGIRPNRPIRDQDRWSKWMPLEYASYVLNAPSIGADKDPSNDRNCIATVRPYRSLMELRQDARKPVFDLSPADGATGSFALASREAFDDFKILVERILERMAVT